MDTNIKPKISIIMITRNRAGFISSAIISVQKQGFTDWELFVLDDDSTDNTRLIIEELASKDTRIKYHKNFPALGISKNRNLGLSKASGKYIAVLDSDDVWIDENKLQKQFEFLENHSDYVLIGSNTKIVNEKNHFIKNTNFKTEDADIRQKILTKNQIAHSSVMYRKDTAEKIHGYDELLSCVEDLDLFLKLGKYGKMKNLSDITTSYTKHSQGTSQILKRSMAWNHLLIALRNIGKYPNWIFAVFVAILRLIKNI